MPFMNASPLKFGLVALIVLLPVGCRQAPIGRLATDVINVPTDIAPEPCQGGLKAVVRVAGVELFDDTVPLNSEATRSTNEVSSVELYQGAPVVAEAWCFGEGGVEVGYTQISGTLNLYYPSDSLNVYPYAPDDSQCSTGIRRGRFPCVVDGDLVQ